MHWIWIHVPLEDEIVKFQSLLRSNSSFRCIALRLSFSRHQTESTQWDPFSSTSARRNTENRRGKVSFKLHLLQLHSAPLIIIIISYFFSFFTIPPAHHSSSSLMVTRTTTQRRRTVESRNCKIVNILHAGGCNLQAFVHLFFVFLLLSSTLPLLLLLHAAHSWLCVCVVVRSLPAWEFPTLYYYYFPGRRERKRGREEATS